MHARGSVMHSKPPSFKLDVAEDFYNHWHAKGVLLKDIPATGVRLYNYFDDGVCNTVGRLECARYVFLSDPRTGHGLAIVDEHWTYGIRSAAAATLACKWLGPAKPRVITSTTCFLSRKSFSEYCSPLMSVKANSAMPTSSELLVRTSSLNWICR